MKQPEYLTTHIQTLMRRGNISPLTFGEIQNYLTWEDVSFIVWNYVNSIIQAHPEGGYPFEEKTKLKEND